MERRSSVRRLGSRNASQAPVGSRSLAAWALLYALIQRSAWRNCPKSRSVVSHEQISLAHRSKLSPFDPFRRLLRPSFWDYPDFLDSFGREILRSSSPEIASWYIRSTPSGDMLHLLHKKGRRSDHLSTSTLLRKEEEDGPNSRASHQLGERSARLARRFGGGLDLKQHSRRYSRCTLRGLRGQQRHHGGRDFWSDRLAPDAAHSLLPGGLCRRAHGKPLRSQARAVSGPTSFSGNDRTGAHRSSGGCKFHRPAWRRYTAWSGREGCAERPAARVGHDPLCLWHPRPLVPVHRRSAWRRTWGQSRTRAPLPTLKKGQSRFGSRAETLAALTPSYPYQTKPAEAGSLPAPKSLLFLLAVQPASPECRLSLCRGLSHSGFAPHLSPPPVVSPLAYVARDGSGATTER